MPDVLRAAARQTPAGVVLVNPLVVQSAEDRQTVRNAERLWRTWGRQVKAMYNGERDIPESWAKRLEGRSETRLHHDGQTRV